MHHLLAQHKDDVQARTRVMTTLGRMYFSLLEDYPRAAFWWRKAGVARGGPRTGRPASTWRSATGGWAAGRWPSSSWAAAAEVSSRSSSGPTSARRTRPCRSPRTSPGTFTADTAYLYAGDACRVAGRFRRPCSITRRSSPSRKTASAPRGIRIARGRTSRRSSCSSCSDVRRVPDGTYQASSLGYEAPVAVEVVVRDRPPRSRSG